MKKMQSILLLTAIILGFVPCVLADDLRAKTAEVIWEKTWEAVLLLASDNAKVSAKVKLLQSLRSEREMPSAEQPVGGRLRQGLMFLVGNTIKNAASKPDEMTKEQQDRVDTVLKASEYLFSELDGKHSNEANEWLAMMWNHPLPLDGSVFINWDASEWKNVIGRYSIVPQAKRKEWMLED